MELKIDALNGGKVHFEGGDASASGVVLNGHTRVGGKVDIQFGVTAMIKACVMGPCATLTAGGSASVQAGFDAIYGYAEDPAVRGSYLDASSDNYLGESLMVPEVTSPTLYTIIVPSSYNNPPCLLASLLIFLCSVLFLYIHQVRLYMRERERERERFLTVRVL